MPDGAADASVQPSMTLSDINIVGRWKVSHYRECGRAVPFQLFTFAEALFIKFVLALVWALLGVSLSFIATGASFIVFLAIALLPITLTAWSSLREKAIANRQFNGLLRQAGIPRIQGISHLEGGAGIVMNHEKGKVLIADGMHARAYNFDEIRSWEARKRQWTGGARGIYMQGIIPVSAASPSLDHSLDYETGFFITVRDVEHPLWRISMFKEADRSRWTDIFKKALNGIERGGKNAST